MFWSSQLNTSKNIDNFIYKLDKRELIPCFICNIDRFGKRFQEVGIAYKKDDFYIIKRKNIFLLSSIDKKSFYDKCVIRNLEFII